MIFLPFDNPTRRTDLPPQKDKLPFGFIVLFINAMCNMILCQLLDNGLALANIPTRTTENYEYWRIITAPFATLDGFLGIAAVLISFWWLVGLMPIYERKYSTIHLLNEFFIQNLQVQFLYTIVATILVREGQIIETYNSYLFNLGLFPIVIIWMFKFGAQEPENRVSFCFLPFMIRKKFLPWVGSIFIIILSHQRMALYIATFLGFVQFILLGRSLIKLPLCLYRIQQKLTPPFVTKLDRFICLQEAQKDINQLYRFQGAASQKNSQNRQSETQEEIKTPKTKQIERLQNQLKEYQAKMEKKESEENFNVEIEVSEEMQEIQGRDLLSN